MLDATDPTDTKVTLESVRSASASSASVTRRTDVLTGNVVIFAPSRGRRPNQFQESAVDVSASSDGCPFCFGSEALTPDPVWAGKIVDGAGASGKAEFEIETGELARTMVDWGVRVVPNKYPAVESVRQANPRSAEDTKSSGRTDSSSARMMSQSRAFGGHEVIIETPRHVCSCAELDLSEITLSMLAMRDRVGFWFRTEDIRYISVFKNAGAAAGASLPHSHSQLIATDFVPPRITDQVSRLQRYRASTGCCLYCDMIRAELQADQRVIAKTNHLIAFCPFASRGPMMVRVAPLQHQNRFDQIGESLAEEIGRLVARVGAWLQTLCPGASHNMLLYTQPPKMKFGEDSFHWHIDFLPRLTSLAGFEFGSDCMINSVLPETAADNYRACADAESPHKVVPPVS